jgi:hypothetical protein
MFLISNEVRLSQLSTTTPEGCNKVGFTILIEDGEPSSYFVTFELAGNITFILVPLTSTSWISVHGVRSISSVRFEQFYIRNDNNCGILSNTNILPPFSAID